MRDGAATVRPANDRRPTRKGAKLTASNSPPLIPGGDSELLAKAQMTKAVVAASPATYGLATGDVTILNNLILAFGAAKLDHDQSQEAAKAARAAKEQARADLVEYFRSINRTALGTGGCTDADRLAAGFSLLEVVRNPVLRPTMSAVVVVESGGRFTHVVRILATGRPKGGKPPGVAYYKLYVKIGGAPPLGLSDCQYVGDYSKGRVDRTYADADGGKTCYYIAVAANSKGETGPASETVAATIAA